MERMEEIVEIVLLEQGITKDYEKGFNMLKDAVLMVLEDSSLTKKHHNKADSIFFLLAEQRKMSYESTLRVLQLALIRSNVKQSVLQFLTNIRLEVLKQL